MDSRLEDFGVRRFSEQRLRRQDLLFAPLCEGALILIVGLAAWISHQPLLFASLGPTAYELVETPKRPSARPYNIIVGHLIAVVVGFAALYATNAWSTPNVMQGPLSWERMLAAVAASLATVFCTLLARAAQPAALATTLLIALGLMQDLKDGVIIMAAVVLMTLVGEPLRSWRARTGTDE